MENSRPARTAADLLVEQRQTLQEESASLVQSFLICWPVPELCLTTIHSESVLETDLGDGIVQIGRGETFVGSRYRRGGERDVQPTRRGSARAARCRSEEADVWN